MDATTLLNKHIDTMTLLEHFDFDNVRNDGGMIRCSCKLHGGNNPTGFVINPDNALWYCHTGDCGGGDAYTLIQKLNRCTFPESVNYLADLFGVDIENMQITERKDKHIKELKSWVDVMKSHNKSKDLKSYHIDVPVREVTKFRGFDEETLRHFGLGYIEEISLEKKSGETYTLHNRLSFPIIQDGVQVGVSLRRVKSSDYPKWSHQPNEIQTSELLYNYDATKGASSVVIVEGIPDVWAFYEIGITAVATFGAHITQEQYRLLMKTGAKLVFAYDGDDAGKETTQKAIKLFKYKADMECVEFYDGEDPDSITREELRNRYDGRKRV